MELHRIYQKTESFIPFDIFFIFCTQDIMGNFFKQHLRTSFNMSFSFSPLLYINRRRFGYQAENVYTEKKLGYFHTLYPKCICYDITLLQIFNLR